MGSPRRDDYQPLTQATVCLMSPLKGVFDNAVEISSRQAVLICEAKKEFIHRVSVFFSLLVLLFQNEYLNKIVIYLSRLSVQLR